MEDNIIEIVLEFSQELYEKNIAINDFSNKEIDEMGVDE